MHVRVHRNSHDRVHVRVTCTHCMSPEMLCRESAPDGKLLVYQQP